MSFMSANLTGAPVFEHDTRAELVRQHYDSTHPGDTFDDLKRRARFDKHDKGLLREWLALAAEREMQSPVTHQLDTLFSRLERL